MKLLLFLAATPLFAQENLIETRENFPRTHNIQLTPHVNLFTGEYIEEEEDLVVAGTEPLSLRRFYGHHNPHIFPHAHWRFNPEHFCTANFEWNKQDLYVSVGDAEGGALSFQKKVTSGLFAFQMKPEWGYTHTALHGQKHPSNTTIRYWTEYPNKSSRFHWAGEIKQGDGSIKTFQSELFDWKAQLPTDKYPPTEYGPYKYTPDVWTPYQLPVLEERKPNGNIICYKYEKHWTAATAEYPTYLYLSEIKAYNRSKTKLLSSITFSWENCGQRMIAQGSDGRKAVFQIEFLPNPRNESGIRAVEAPGLPTVWYDFLYPKTCRVPHTIGSVERPEGRKFVTKYNKGGQVVAQHDGKGHPLFRYAYHTNHTEVWDAEGNKTDYFYDNNKRFTRIAAAGRQELFQWDSETGNLLAKELRSVEGNLLLRQEYGYDKNQNVIREKVGDGKESYTLYRAFSEDGFNLPLKEWDDFGKHVEYSYEPGTNLLSREVVYEGKKIRKRTFHTYDDCASCIRTVVDDGSGEAALDLKDVSYRKITEIKPKAAFPCLGFPEEVVEKTIDRLGNEILLSKKVYTYTPHGQVAREDHYDSEGVYQYSLGAVYDRQERCIAKIDAIGRKTEYSYDANNNLLSIKGPREDFYKKWTYNHHNQPISEEVSGGLKASRVYDHLGRVTSSVDICGFETRYAYDGAGNVIQITHPDGAIEKKAYDAAGRVIRESDEEGYVKTRTYHFSGKVAAIDYPDGTHERFVYRPDGNLMEKIDRNQAVTKYEYDVFGNLIEERVASKKKMRAEYSPFAVISTTNPEGLRTAYKYDYAGRKVSEEVGGKKTEYVYDSLGRVSRVIRGDVIEAFIFDAANQLIEKREETLFGEVLTQESYAYDALGNRIQVRHSKGVFESHYTPYGIVAWKKDPLGYTTSYLYTFLHGKEVREIAPNGVQRVVRYNARGKEREIRCENARGEVLQKEEREYDSRGNQTARSFFVYEEGRWVRQERYEWKYGAMNQLLESVGACGEKTSYSYDLCGRLERQEHPGGERSLYAYDEIGRLQAHSGKGFDYQYAYDACDRVVKVEDRKLRTKTLRKYDVEGNLVEEVLGNSLRIKNQYDARGKRTALEIPDGSKIEFAYQHEKLKKLTRKKTVVEYVRRDLEGRVEEIVFPVGKLSIERDPLFRISKQSSPFYMETCRYDGVGNLVAHSGKDSLGAFEQHFGYSDLKQLSEEAGHHYLYDSVDNRVEKDGQKFAFGAGNREVVGKEYDERGNLVRDGEVEYQYDGLDRLVQVRRNRVSYHYEYDAFNRRLSKEGEGKKELYIWDGQNEVGRAEVSGGVKELRVLGEGLGAEIGGAVLIEMGKEQYVPVHDYRGSVVQLVPLDKKEKGEVYRYGGFGEKVAGGRRSPWLFLSKRWDEHVGGYFFGRRYYRPDLGRWLTRDPKGFVDGANLYAYVRNNPTSLVDLYGLYAEDRAYGHNPAREFRDRTGRGRTCPHDYRDFEDQYREKACSFDLGRPKYDETVLDFFLNGLGNTKGSAKESAEMISNENGGKDITIIHKPSHGSFLDCVAEYIVSYCFHKLTPVAYEGLDKIHRHFAKYKENGCLIMRTHSHGNVIALNMLKHLPKEIRDRTAVIAIAPGAYIPKELCAYVQHYVSDRDLVPYIDFMGRIRGRENITYLKAHPDAPLFDHTILSPTYRPIFGLEYDYIMHNVFQK